MGVTYAMEHTMTAHDSLLSYLQDARRRFLDLIDECARNYIANCARMTGPIADGEELSKTLSPAPTTAVGAERMPVYAVLFRIAHNRRSTTCVAMTGA